MCPQFVDFDGDGYTDIITATYEGSPFLVRGSASGWQQPEAITNAEGNPIRLSIYWDNENSRWSNADGTAMDAYSDAGHLISAAVHDWDNDGDFDLLVGSYGGLLYLHRNEGAPGSPKFTVKNEPVQVAGQPFKLEGGLSAPRLVDWDGDGLTDIVAGGMKGGVYLYRNAGTKDAPKFEAATTLIATSDNAATGAQQPNTGLYVDPVDYDSDGDLDLIVGGYAQWTPQARQLSDEEKQRIEALNAEMKKTNEAMQKMWEPVMNGVGEDTPQEEIQARYEAITNTEEFKTVQARHQELWQELSKLQPGPQRQAGVWLYRQK